MFYFFLEDIVLDKCGCGNDARYVKIGESGIEEQSCNRYGRCPTYEEIRTSLEVSSKRLGVFKKAVDMIDDYFEYSNESKKDQKKVFQILGNLTDALANT